MDFYGDTLMSDKKNPKTNWQYKELVKSLVETISQKRAHQLIKRLKDEYEIGEFLVCREYTKVK